MKKEDFDSWIAMDSHNNYVYLVKKGNKEFILKHDTKERDALQQWRNKLPVPKIINAGEDFLLLEKLPGVTGIKNSSKETYYQLGDLLGIIHNSQPVKKGELITHPEQFWQDKLYDLKGYCHGDTAPGNFLLENNKITGIIDWEFAGEGDIIKDTFKSVKYFFKKWEFRHEIYKGHKKHLEFPSNWEKVALVQQWIQYKKLLKSVNTIIWKELNEEETKKRRNRVIVEWNKSLKKIEEFYNTI